MKRLGLILIYACISFEAQASETYELKGIAYAQTNTEACRAALEYLKKQSLLYAGAILPIPVSSPLEKTKELAAEKPAEAANLSDTLVNVISKEEAARKDKKDNYLCVVTAKLAVDVDGVMRQNLIYKGQLPTWMVMPPARPGKIALIAKSKTLDGAVARALQKYADILAGDDEQIRYVESLLDGKPSVYAKETQVNPEVKVKWKRKYYMLGGKTDPLFIHTFSEQTIFHKDGKTRVISEYREIESENGFVSNFENEASGESKGRLGVNKASAKLDSLIDSLKHSGFEIQYQQLAMAGSKEWYVLLLGDKPVLKNQVEAHFQNK